MTDQVHHKIIAAMPATVAEIATLLGATPQSVTQRLRRLKDKRLVHLGGWKAATGEAGRAAAIWHAGMGDKVAYVLRTPPTRSNEWLSVESIVASAMACQPNSVFALGDRARA